MERYNFFGYEVEVDLETTQRWYAKARGWPGKDVGSRNFRAFVRKGQLPAFVLEYLDKLGIPPRKATYILRTGADPSDHDRNGYSISYRIAGNILSEVEWKARQLTLDGPIIIGPKGWCLHEPSPRCAPKFPEPHFDLEFKISIPWVLDEPWVQIGRF